jgi:PAS domain S-box-containing protein
MDRLRELQDQVETANEVLDGDADLVCIWRNERIVMANRGFTTLLGWPLQDVLGTPWVAFLHPEDAAETERTAREVSDRRTSLRRIVNRWKKRDGSYATIEWTASAPTAHGYSVAIGVISNGS